MFNTGRLDANPYHIVLCYKVQFRLRRLIKAISEAWPHTETYIGRGRYLLWALVCQGLLNDKYLDYYADTYGVRMTMEADYTERLVKLATTRCRILISHLVKSDAYAAKVVTPSRS